MAADDLYACSAKTTSLMGGGALSSVEGGEEIEVEVEADSVVKVEWLRLEHSSCTVLRNKVK